MSLTPTWPGQSYDPVGQLVQPQRDASYMSQAFPISCLTLSTVISILLFVAAHGDWRTTGSLLTLTSQHRASVQIVVHLLSGCLGTAQVLVVCSLLRWQLNIHTTKRAISLDNLSFWTAVCGRSFDFSLSKRRMGQLVVVLFLFQALGLLWAGSTTPVIGDVFSCENSTIDVARYSTDSILYWNVTCDGCEFSGTAHYKVLPEGMFGWSPWESYEGEYVNQAAQASTVSGAPQEHAKTDNSGYSYIGRSYGVGASVGLLPIPDNTTTYTFYENGYYASVQCSTNEDANMTLVPLITTPHYSGYAGGGALTVWRPEGYLPNTGNTLHTNNVVPSFDQTILSILAGYGDDRYIWGMVPGNLYAMFANMQCEVFFNASKFLVSVDTTTKIITVDPQANGSVYDIDLTGMLKLATFLQPRVFSQIDATLVTSKLGSAFGTNVQYVVDQEGRDDTVSFSAFDGDTTNSICMRGTEEALTSLIDNVLVGFAAAQVMNANDTLATEVTFCKPALRLGTNTYIFGLLGVSLALVLVYIEEAVRTRLWRALPNFDSTNVKCAIVGGASGGNAAIKAIASGWDGSADDKTVGGLEVRLRKGREGYGWDYVGMGKRASSMADMGDARMAANDEEGEDDRVRLVNFQPKGFDTGYDRVVYS